MSASRFPGPCGYGLEQSPQNKLSSDLQVPWQSGPPYIPGFLNGCRYGHSPGPSLAWIKAIIEIEERQQKERAEDEAEFKLIEAYFVGRIAGKGNYRAFAYVEDYLRHRDEHFASRQEYLRYAAESDQELSEGVRGIINKPERQLSPTEEQQAQAVFYRWLRKAYQKKFNVVNVAADLATRRKDYERLEHLVEAFILPAGAEPGDAKAKELDWAFVPRPERKMASDGRYRYLLGTISGHARGTSVDIKPGSNPDVAVAAWDFMTDYLGTPFKRDLNRWKNDPEGLIRDVKALSDGFSAKVVAEVDLVELYQSLLTEQKNAYCIVPQGHDLTQVAMFSDRSPGGDVRYLLYMIRSEGKDPFPGRNDVDKYIGPKFLSSKPVDLVLDIALSNYKSSSKPSKDQLQKLLNGFFDLSPETVKAFRKYGFTWGVIYTQPDLMHFAADGDTPPRNAP